jgi:hypothetical protein
MTRPSPGPHPQQVPRFLFSDRQFSPLMMCQQRRLFDTQFIGLNNREL